MNLVVLVPFMRTPTPFASRPNSLTEEPVNPSYGSDAALIDSNLGVCPSWRLKPPWLGAQLSPPYLISAGDVLSVTCGSDLRPTAQRPIAGWTCEMGGLA